MVQILLTFFLVPPPQKKSFKVVKRQHNSIFVIIWVKLKNVNIICFWSLEKISKASTKFVLLVVFFSHGEKSKNSSLFHINPKTQ